MRMTARVLIVDDETLTTKLLSHCLKSEPSVEAVETANSGPEALYKAAAFRPNLLITDIMMPGMTGFEILDELRAHTKLPDLVITASKPQDVKERIKSIGRADVLFKPIDPQVLVRRSIKLVERYGKDVAFDHMRESYVTNKFGELYISHKHKAVSFKGKSSSLTNSELALIMYLATRSDRFVPTKELMREALGYKRDAKQDSLLVGWLISQIREKLSEKSYSSSLIIETPEGFQLRP